MDGSFRDRDDQRNDKEGLASVENNVQHKTTLLQFKKNSHKPSQLKLLIKCKLEQNFLTSRHGPIENRSSEFFKYFN